MLAYSKGSRNAKIQPMSGGVKPELEDCLLLQLRLAKSTMSAYVLLSTTDTGSTTIAVPSRRNIMLLKDVNAMSFLCIVGFA